MTRPNRSQIQAFQENTGINSPFAFMMETPPRKMASRILGLTELDRRYYEIMMMKNDDPFLNRLLKVFNLEYDEQPDAATIVPPLGPVVVVSNHPFGGIDGIILMHILKQVRPDLKVLANYMLGRIREIADLFFLVDPFETNAAITTNIRPTRQAIDWLNSGGLVLTFPSGEVSHIEWTKWKATDPTWNKSLGHLIRRTKATVVPVYFPGRNSAPFQAAGLIHPLLRTALLPRELLNKSGRRIVVRFGEPIPFEHLAGFRNNQALTSHIRQLTYALKDQKTPPPRTTSPAVRAAGGAM